MRKPPVIAAFILLLAANLVAQVTNGFFGVDLTTGFRPVTLDASWPPQFRVQSLRLWGTRTRWADLEPCAPVAATIDAELGKSQEPDPVGNGGNWACKTNSSYSSFDFRNLDSALDAATAQGITDIEYTFGHAPQFAVTTTDDTVCAYHGYLPWANCHAPVDVQDTTTVCSRLPTGMRFGQNGDCTWKEGVYGVGKHLKNTSRNIGTWSVWNEISGTSYFRPNCQTADSQPCKDMARMAADAYNILKAIDPTWIVLTPSTTRKTGGGSTATFMTAYLTTTIADQGLGTHPGQYADGLTHHAYTDTNGVETAAEAVIPILDDHLAVMTSGNFMSGKPIYMDEGGWGIGATLSETNTANVATYSKSGTTVTATTSTNLSPTVGEDIFLEGSYPQIAAGYSGSTNGHKVTVTGTSGTTIKWTDATSEALPTLLKRGQITTSDCGGGWACIDPLSVKGAAFITRYFLIHAAKGYRRVYWYSNGDRGWGSMFNFWTGTASAPFVPAFDNMQDWLTGATVISSSLFGNPYTINITRPGGYQAQIAWRDSGTASYSVPAPYAPVAGQLRTYQKFDEQTGIDARFTTTSSVTIGELPIMLEAPAIVDTSGTGNVWSGTGSVGGSSVVQ